MLRRGQTFGRYRIDGVAGAGGMGTVYRAHELGLGRPVALKVLAAQHLDDERMRERVGREALNVAKLDHPNVVPLYDAGEADGATYIAMRWIEGRDLEQLVTADGPQSPERALGLIEQVARALDAAHDCNIVHRDVKPANVLVDAADNAYLTDFGLTKTINGSTDATMTDGLLGTIDYVAPEQIEGRPVDRRTDVYALGATAYKLLTGHVPFEREGAVARLWAHLHDAAPVVSGVRPGLPAALDHAVARALEKSQAARFQTAGEFAAALRAATGVRAHAVAAAATPRPRMRRQAVPGRSLASLVGGLEPGGAARRMPARVGATALAEPPLAAESVDAPTDPRAGAVAQALWTRAGGADPITTSSAYADVAAANPGGADVEQGEAWRSPGSSIAAFTEVLAWRLSQLSSTVRARVAPLRPRLDDGIERLGDLGRRLSRVRGRLVLGVLAAITIAGIAKASDLSERTDNQAVADAAVVPVAKSEPRAKAPAARRRAPARRASAPRTRAASPRPVSRAPRLAVARVVAPAPTPRPARRASGPPRPRGGERDEHGRGQAKGHDGEGGERGEDD